MSDFSSNKKDILIFDPDVYVVLKEWLKLFNSDTSLNPDLTYKEAGKIHPELCRFLENRGFRQ